MWDRLSELWERMQPRERRLAVLAGFIVFFGLIMFVVTQVWDGLGELADQNEAKREALRTIDEKREELLASRNRSGDPMTQIGDEAPSLGTYLEKISKEVGVEIKSSKPAAGAAPKGSRFHEVAVQITLYDLTLDKLAAFLKRIETDSPIIVTQRIFVKRAMSQKEKMDRVEITVATWERAKKKEAPKPAAAEAAKEP